MVNRCLLHVLLTTGLLVGGTTIVSAAAASPTPGLAPGEFFDWAAIRRENLQPAEAPLVVTPATLSMMRFATTSASRSRTPVSVKVSRLQRYSRRNVKLPRTP